jgi:integrase
MGTLNGFLDIFESKILPERKLSKSTQTFYRKRLAVIRKHFGSLDIPEIGVLCVSSFLIEQPACISNQYRQLLGNIFKHAVAMGYAVSNPAIITIPRNHAKARQRMCLRGFYAIHAKSPRYLQNAMDLALQTLQRRNDICKIKLKDIEGKYLKIIQSKTKKHGYSAYLKIEITKPLLDVISHCKDDILSPYLIHRLPDRLHHQNLKLENREHLTQVLPDYLTKAFNKAREASGFYNHLPIEERPTFHEIRPLGAKLYKDAGIDPQTLLGHTDKHMTDYYLSGHGDVWTVVQAGLSLAPNHLP